MAREDRLDAVGAEQGVEIATLAADRDLMPELHLSTREIDGRVDMAVQPTRVIQQMENTHDLRAHVSDPRLCRRCGSAGAATPTGARGTTLVRQEN